MDFFIKNEEYFQDNKKLYQYSICSWKQKYSKIDLTYGPILKHNKPYLEFEINNIEKIEELVPKTKYYYIFN